MFVCMSNSGHFTAQTPLSCPILRTLTCWRITWVSWYFATEAQYKQNLNNFNKNERCLLPTRTSSMFFASFRRVRGNLQSQLKCFRLLCLQWKISDVSRCVGLLYLMYRRVKDHWVNLHQVSWSMHDFISMSVHGSAGNPIITYRVARLPALAQHATTLLRSPFFPIKKHWIIRTCFWIDVMDAFTRIHEIGRKKKRIRSQSVVWKNVIRSSKTWEYMLLSIIPKMSYYQSREWYMDVVSK